VVFGFIERHRRDHAKGARPTREEPLQNVGCTSPNRYARTSDHSSHMKAIWRLIISELGGGPDADDLTRLSTQLKGIDMKWLPASESAHVMRRSVFDLDASPQGWGAA
jgi:hypothetical protein